MGGQASRSSQGTPSSSTVPMCSICSSLPITAMLRDGLPAAKMVPLGPLVDILHKADQCRFCKLVASLYRRLWRLDTLPDVDLSGVVCSLYATGAGALANPRLEERKQCQRLCIDFSVRPTKITDAVLQARMDLNPEIQLLEEDAHKFQRSKEVHGRRMAETVDIGIMKRWISLCEQEHGDACKSVWWRGDHVGLPLFVRMVDVTLMSVVRAPPDCRYVALSYVWGTTGSSYWTTKANVDLRASPAGLDSSVLPATILDSIHVTQALGERYLWIDALCIIEDSSDDKGDQIGVMELIYSGALLTIVAAGGESAHAGLPGISAGSRSLHQHVEVIQDLHLAIPLPSLNESIAQTIWDTRAWTYQEMLLSRRRLFFTKDQVYFECNKDIWCEDLVAESKTVLYSYHPMRLSGSGGGLLFLPEQFSKLPVARDLNYTQTYSRVIERYTQRHLTFQRDIVHAITAVTEAMTRGYRLARGSATTPAFRYGIPIWNLNHSLLWQPRLDAVHARRVTPDAGVASWPSWAWVGWTGAAYYSDLNQLLHTDIWTTVQVKPEESLIKHWYIIDDHQQLVHLDVQKISFIQIGEAEDGAPPKYLKPEGDIDASQLGPLPLAGTLVFRTQCTSFKVLKVEDTSNNQKPFPHTIFHILSDIRQPSAAVGRMILPFDTPSSTPFEFIVLSRCGDMHGLYDESIYGNPYDACLLHVMAVRRVEHDARMRERVGLGVIFEQAWLECGAKVETIFLG